MQICKLRAKILSWAFLAIQPLSDPFNIQKLCPQNQYGTPQIHYAISCLIQACLKPRLRVRLAQKQSLWNFVTFLSFFFQAFFSVFLPQNIDYILSMVTSSDARVGQHPTSMEEVKGSKKFGVGNEKYDKKTGGQQMCPLLAPCPKRLDRFWFAKNELIRLSEYYNRKKKKLEF